ncbi:MAG: hypothetical protein ACUVQ6_00010 [Dissulfurimicrobium sp.]|uniref:hypothetical protein n=1 Tax=Dissulfurimicrobium sp. TaxID=2022436 RepID=UPI00404950A7
MDETNSAILTAIPIKDFNDKAIGVLVARTDISDIRKAFTSKIQSTLIKGVVSISIFLLLVFYFLKTRLKRPLYLLTERMKDLCSGETDLTRQLDLPAVNCSKATKCHEQDCHVTGGKSIAGMRLEAWLQMCAVSRSKVEKLETANSV